MRARTANKIQSKIGALIYGQQFSGKSTLASQLAYFKRPEDGKPFRVLYVDAENGSIDDMIDKLEEDGIDTRNIWIVYTQSIGEVKQLIAKIKNNEDFYNFDDEGNETDEVILDADGQPFRADAIVLDGTTVMNMSLKQSLIEFSKKRNSVKAKAKGLVGEERLVAVENSGLELRDYQVIGFKNQDLVLDLMSTGINYVITAREANEKETVKDKDGKITSIDTGKKVPDGMKGVTYNVKTVIHTCIDDDGSIYAVIEKDRTGVHTANEVVENPTLLDWQSVIDKTAKNEKFVVKNSLVESVEKEQDIYSREVLGSAGKPIAKDEINNEDSSTTSTDEVADIKSKITAIQKSLNPVQKSAAKTALSEAGLPTALKTVTDIEVLNKCLEILSNIK